MWTFASRFVFATIHSGEQIILLQWRPSTPRDGVLQTCSAHIVYPCISWIDFHSTRPPIRRTSNNCAAWMDGFRLVKFLRNRSLFCFQEVVPREDWSVVFSSSTSAQEKDWFCFCGWQGSA